MKAKANISFTTTFELNEMEIKALDALAGYGTDSFLEVFYKRMGEHYLKPNEAGIRSLFEKVKTLRGVIGEIENARTVIEKAIQERNAKS